MPMLTVTATAGPDGRLHLDLPVPAGQYRVEVTPLSATPAPAAGWPPGFLESTFGCIQDEAYEAPTRSPSRPVPPLDSE